MFMWWLAGPDTPVEHRELIDQALREMVYAFTLGDGPREPDAPSWWMGDDEAAESSTVLGHRTTAMR